MRIRDDNITPLKNSRSAASTKRRERERDKTGTRNFKFYPKITKIGVIKKVDHHPINSRNYAAAYYQTLEEVLGTMVPEKIQKHEKFANILKNC